MASGMQTPTLSTGVLKVEDTMKTGVLVLVLAVIVTLGFATPPAHADGIDFTSSSGGGNISYNGTATGMAIGTKIPITDVAFTGMPLNVVTGFTCGSGASTFACGRLAFTTGSFSSSTATSFTFNGGGSLTIMGSVTGGSAVTLVSATFVGPVTVTQVSGKIWSLVGSLSVMSVDPSLAALFPSIVAPASGALDSLVIKFKMVGTGFIGTATSQDVFISAVPEPSSMLLLGSGFMAIGTFLRKRNKK